MKTNNFNNKRNITENNRTIKKQEKETFSYSIYNKHNFRKFCKLKEDKTVKIISINDLPHEFNEELSNFINLFRRKTVNEKTEWELYIDYENNEIIHCLHGQATNVKDYVHSGLMKDRKIMTIHNHPKNTYSAPSVQNFEIMEHEFEDYEIICSENEYWILKAKGYYEKTFRCEFKKEIKDIFDYSDSFKKNKSF